MNGTKSCPTLRQGDQPLVPCGSHWLWKAQVDVRDFAGIPR